MDSAVLLAKLQNYDNKDFELFQIYLDATVRSFATAEVEFITCIEDIKNLTDKQYDFSWLAENAAVFGCNRREFKNLCDDVCVLLGHRIDELCSHSRELIITVPSEYEDYCPFSSETLVAYGKVNNSVVRYDGKMYNIVDTKLEDTPYYCIHCSSLSY